MQDKKATVTIIYDGQYGSCGKGAYSQWLAGRERPAVAIRTGGPNAGHRVLTQGDRQSASLRAVPHESVALRQIPAAVAGNTGRGKTGGKTTTDLIIPRAGLVNPDVLREEIEKLVEVGLFDPSRLHIDPMATVITPGNIETERSAYGIQHRIGSTGEGVGAAQSMRVNRLTSTFGEHIEELDAYHDLRKFARPTRSRVDAAISAGRDIHIEMTQGYGLSLYGDHYPKVTSRDITPAQALSDANISPTDPRVNTRAHMLVRTYPIRVAGNSGDFGGRELSWGELHERTGGYIKAEKTTVTQLERRVAEWDHDEIERAVKYTRPTAGVLMFADYILPELGQLLAEGGRTERDHAEDMLLTHWHRGTFDAYRAPFRAHGTDIGAISLGFGEIFLTPEGHLLSRGTASGRDYSDGAIQDVPFFARDTANDD